MPRPVSAATSPLPPTSVSAWSFAHPSLGEEPVIRLDDLRGHQAVEQPLNADAAVLAATTSRPPRRGSAEYAWPSLDAGGRREPHKGSAARCP